MCSNDIRISAPPPSIRSTRLILALAITACCVGSAPAVSALLEERSFDGSGNNLSNSSWGSAGTPLLRKAPADYPGNGSGDTLIEAPARANPRDISNRIVAADPANPRTPINDRGMSNFVWQWGQFIDHDIDLTHFSVANGSVPIAVNDPGDPFAPGPIPFDRSDFVTDGSGTRQQLNAISAYIDASNVYGSDQATADALRSFSDGKLRSSSGELLPVDPISGLFVAGDERANEQLGLTAMHTVFMREHNRVADLLASQAGLSDDEAIYQTARKIIGAELQIITYREFLPTLLGDHAPTLADLAYDPGVNASITNEFSGALYRFGHSMLPTEFELRDDNRQLTGTIGLRDAFFNPDVFKNDPDKLDQLLQGFADQPASEIDKLLVDDVRNFLFGAPGAGGLDLAALNIQRGRDHGLPDYNSLRQAYGLSPVSSFGDISSDPAIQAALFELFGSVDDIDAWIGGLAEDHLDDASVGELLAAALNDQFSRIATGDRLFWLWDPDILDDAAIAQVIDFDQVSLGLVLSQNTTVSGLRYSVFNVPLPGSLALTLPALLLLAWSPHRRPTRVRPNKAPVPEKTFNVG